MKRAKLFEIVHCIFAVVASLFAVTDAVALPIMHPGFEATVLTSSGLDTPRGIAVAPNGRELFVANSRRNNSPEEDYLSKIDISQGPGYGSLQMFANVGPSDPRFLTFNSSGQLFANTNSMNPGDGRGRVLQFNPNGSYSVYSNVGADSPGGGLQFDLIGNYGNTLYIGITGYQDFIGRIVAPGANATVFSSLGSFPTDTISSPSDIIFGYGAFGTDMYVVLVSSNQSLLSSGIYKITTTGEMVPFITLDELPGATQIGNGLALSQGGPFGEYLYFSTENNMYRASPNGNIEFFGTGFDGVFDLAFSDDPVLFVSDARANTIYAISPVAESVPEPEALSLVLLGLCAASRRWIVSIARKAPKLWPAVPCRRI